jgi:nitrogen-specific signal transduction histidine kinase
MLRRFLEALDEPALLLSRSGAIRHANAAVQRLLRHIERPLVGCSLGELVADAPDDVTTLLRRFSGTSQAVIGRFFLRMSDGSVQKYRSAAAGSPGPGRRSSCSSGWRTSRTSSFGC